MNGQQDHFAGANQHHVLIDVLGHLNMRILVPGEVDDEVASKDSKYPGLKARWRRLTGSDRIEVLPRLTIDDPDQAEVLAHFATLRGQPSAKAIRVSQHRGEFAVVAHALVRQEAGETVIVLIDDGDAQVMAADQGLSVVDIPTLLESGHKGGVTGLKTLAEVRAVYNALLPFGDGLPRWKKSELYRKLTAAPVGEAGAG